MASQEADFNNDLKDTETEENGTDEEKDDETDEEEDDENGRFQTRNIDIVDRSCIVIDESLILA